MPFGWLLASPEAEPVFKVATLPPISTKYNLTAYCDDLKPAITNIYEFYLVERVLIIFEMSSGCKRPLSLLIWPFPHSRFGHFQFYVFSLLYCLVRTQWKINHEKWWGHHGSGARAPKPWCLGTDILVPLQVDKYVFCFV